ncbi:CLUMA_CG007093, isoform A [Clunio marinus]|uniref:CLUMA_CG007093, isoform A n=1 Tax=Clunio marinus TaxID=568069 RepID=A0A1J1HZM8_9DIPT|nr:CLUMA_CG007093, isoform A [Clunio marinus]
MKLLHLFLVVIIAEEVFSGDGNSCSSPPLPFSPSDIINRLESIKDLINNLVTQYLPFFEGADVSGFDGTNEEKSDNAFDLLIEIQTILSDNGVQSSVASFLSILDIIHAIIFNTESTGNEKKIDEIIASVNAVNQILLEILQSIVDQIAIETASSVDYLSGVMTQQIDPADYPISCIAEALIQMYQFVFNTYGTIEDTAIAAKASMEAMP